MDVIRFRYLIYRLIDSFRNGITFESKRCHSTLEIIKNSTQFFHLAQFEG